MVSNEQNLSSDDTLERIHEFANRPDVEMQDAFALSTIILVPDTNVLIDYCSVIEQFCVDVEAQSLPIKIVIPSVVLSELDGLKNRNDLQWFARTASTWMLTKMRERKTVKMQSMKEAYDLPIPDAARENDFRILFCCMFFQTRGHVFLLSQDKIFCAESIGNGVPAITPSGSWSSRDLARTIAEELRWPIDITLFQGHERAPRYRPSRTKGSKRLGQTFAPSPDDDDDRMDVDPTGSTAEDFVPSHALDALHLQIIDHFTAVLKEIADGVRKRTGDLAPAVSTSVHAPAHRRKEFNSWTIGDCLEYLGTKQVLRTSTPPLRVFLLRRNAERGWRRGQDWSRQDWMNALEALHDVGMKFQSGVLLRSLEAVMPHVFWIFNSPMRPTGI